MRDPGSVVAVAGFALFVGSHLREGLFIGDRIGLDGDVRRHSAHGVDVAAVAGLDGELRVAAHEMRGHGHLAAIGQHGVRIVGEFLDEAEDVVPAAAVQTGGVLAQFVEYLVHLESRPGWSR